MTPHDSSRAKRLTGVMLASLVALMLASAAFVVVSSDRHGVGGFPPGVVLAVAKLLALALVFHRVRVLNIHSMQWSSMFILLFVAEGTVRAAGDPQPSATFGAVEAIAAVAYFTAVLAFLRPLKKRAKIERSGS